MFVYTILNHSSQQVSLSSLNRHAVATRADVGMSKAACLKVRRCLSVVPAPLCLLQGLQLLANLVEATADLQSLFA